MPRYVRAFVPGGTFFFTLATLERRRGLLTANIELLRQSFRAVRAERPFRIEAIVVLPDHLHCIWTLPPEDADFSFRWHAIKAAFSHGISRGERLSTRRQVKGERGVWQRRFWEHVIRDEWDFEKHVDYIHFNPVKHGHVQSAADWEYSSFRKFVAAGYYPPGWAAASEVQELDFE